MTRYSKRGKVTQLFDLRRSESEELGGVIKRAASQGLCLKLTDGPIEPGCEFQVEDGAESAETPAGPGKPHRFNLMQLMVVITVLL